MLEKFGLEEDEYDSLTKGLAIGVGIGIVIGALLGNVGLGFAIGGVVGVVGSLVYSYISKKRRLSSIRAKRDNRYKDK